VAPGCKEGNLEVALVHERFTEVGGAEHVVGELAKLWPTAEVFTTVVDPAALPAGLERERVRPHPGLQRAWALTGSYVPLLPALPAVLRTLPIRSADLVVLSHHAFALFAGEATSRDALVVGYVHTPARWIWDPAFRNREALSALGAGVLHGFARLAKGPEQRAAKRPDLMIANSRFVAERISRWWGRHSHVVHPPVTIEPTFADALVGDAPSPARQVLPRTDGVGSREPAFVLAGRLVPYKRPELAVLAARRAGARLRVVGEGRSRKLLEPYCDASIELLGHLPRPRLLSALQEASALVFPGVEDFGIVPVEAQALGTPVLAVGAGGVLDSVVPGLTGELVPAGTDEEVVARLADAMARFDPDRYDPAVIAAHAEQFSANVFARRILGLVERLSLGQAS